MLVLTLGGDYVYTLAAFLDSDLRGPVDGLTYQNYVLKNCSIRSLSIIQTLVPIAKINVPPSLVPLCHDHGRARYFVTLRSTNIS